MPGGEPERVNRHWWLMTPRCAEATRLTSPDGVATPSTPRMTSMNARPHKIDIASVTTLEHDDRSPRRISSCTPGGNSCRGRRTPHRRTLELRVLQGRPGGIGEGRLQTDRGPLVRDLRSRPRLLLAPRTGNGSRLGSSACPRNRRSTDRASSRATRRADRRCSNHDPGGFQRPRDPGVLRGLRTRDTRPDRRFHDLRTHPSRARYLFG